MKCCCVLLGTEARCSFCQSGNHEVCADVRDNINRNPNPGKDDPDSPPEFVARLFAIGCLTLGFLILTLVLIDFVFKPLLERLSQ